MMKFRLKKKSIKLKPTGEKFLQLFSLKSWKKSTFTFSKQKIEYSKKLYKTIPVDKLASYYAQTYRLFEKRLTVINEVRQIARKKLDFAEIDWDKLRNFVNYRNPYG